MKNTNESLIEDMKILISDVVRRSQYAKEELCKDEPMTDNPPIFFVGYESDPTNPEHDACLEAQEELSLKKSYQMMMIPLIHKDDPFEAFEDVVRSMPIDEFSFIVLAVEGYMRVNSEGLDLSELERGSLEKDYKENPFSDVREGITVTALDWEATTMLTNNVCYRYDDKGVPMWDEPVTGEIEINEEALEIGFGRFGDGLIDATRYMHLAVKALAYKELMSRTPKKGDE